MSRLSRSTFALAMTALAAAACTGGDLGPTSVVSPPSKPSFSAVKFWDANAAAFWMEEANSLTARRTVPAVRLYAYLSLAQLRAAEDAEAIQPHPPTAAAIGAASAAVLKAFFPLDAVEIDDLLEQQRATDPWPGAKHEDAAVGAQLGAAAAARVLAYAAGDRFGLTNPGTPPTTPGHWLWSGGPITRGGYGARPIFLSSSDEFRPPPPPAFGSPEYLAALAEVRQFSDTRTPEQLAIA
jgi:hypothetical protein